MLGGHWTPRAPQGQGGRAKGPIPATARIRPIPCSGTSLGRASYLVADQSSKTNAATTGDDRLRNMAARVAELERALEQERRRRTWRLIGIAAVVSLAAHIVLLVYFSNVIRSGPGGQTSRPVEYELAIVSEEELTSLEQTTFDEDVPSVDSALDEAATGIEASLDPAVASADLEVTGAGAVPTIDGAGASGTAPLGGGGAGASFFGVTSRGLRFVYIVDRSGSMGDDGKMNQARNELLRSVAALPDYTRFYILMFSTAFETPPGQDGWTRARPAAVTRLQRWLNDVDPTGGTQPAPAFRRAFTLEPRPDVIFFLTDGEIPGNTADVVAELNTGGSTVVVNTIAFGDPTSQDLLRRIAADSGGVYRFVSAGSSSMSGSAP